MDLKHICPQSQFLLHRNTTITFPTLPSSNCPACPLTHVILIKLIPVSSPSGNKNLIVPPGRSKSSVN